MNDSRRRKIRDIVQTLEMMKESLNEVLDEEQESFDNMPEGLQLSDRGMDSEEAITNLTEAAENLETVLDILNDF